MKENRMEKFSKLVLWKYPREEAIEIIRDYEEMFLEYQNDGRDFFEEFGNSKKILGQLNQPENYYRWIAIFAYLVFSLGTIVFFQLFRLKYLYLQYSIFISAQFFLLFVIRKKKNGNEHKMFQRNKRNYFVFLFLIVGSNALLIHILETTKMLPELQGKLVTVSLIFTSLFALGIGIVALINARIINTRWKAVYSASLTVAMMCLLVLQILTGTKLDTALSFWDDLKSVEVIGTAIFGFIVTGISLC